MQWGPSAKQENEMKLHRNQIKYDKSLLFGVQLNYRPPVRPISWRDVS